MTPGTVLRFDFTQALQALGSLGARCGARFFLPFSGYAAKASSIIFWVDSRVMPSIFFTLSDTAWALLGNCQGSRRLEAAARPSKPIGLHPSSVSIASGGVPYGLSPPPVGLAIGAEAGSLRRPPPPLAQNPRKALRRHLRLAHFRLVLGGDD